MKKITYHETKEIAIRCVQSLIEMGILYDDDDCNGPIQVQNLIQNEIKNQMEIKTPDYYQGKTYGIQAHEVIEDFAGDNYNLGVAIAYLLRAGKKEGNDTSQDIQKAIDHLNFELKRQSNKQKQT